MVEEIPHLREKVRSFSMQGPPPGKE